MGFFQRVIKALQREPKSLLDRFDESIQETEQGVVRLKKELQTTIVSLSEIRGVATRLRHQVDDETQRTLSCERRAMLALSASAKGDLSEQEAERRALDALRDQELAAHRLITLTDDLKTQDALADRLKNKVDRLRHSIQRLENELVTLRARARTAQSVRKINRQLSQVDSHSTIALLEKMKQRVIEEESLADAYGDLADIEADVERRMTDIGSDDNPPSAETALDLLKQRVSDQEKQP